MHRISSSKHGQPISTIGLFFLLLILLVLTTVQTLLGDTSTQDVSGQVVNAGTEEGLPGAIVVLRRSDTLFGGNCDVNGEFLLTGVLVGRYSLEVSSLGYEPVVIKEVLVTSGKAVVLNVRMNEAMTEREVVQVKAHVTKGRPLNQAAAISGRMLSVEEASRYAGGFDDPARLASSFAGVASSIGNNGIVIRGNAPKSTAWRMEGVEIPSPNHFADLDAIGGGGLTVLSSHLLDNSDFLTGAFPAEYGNALSGVFDIRMRRGNRRQHEHRLQVGLTGIDVASEGPFVLGDRSSYLFNYRYAALSLLSPLLPEDAQGTSYQDLSFKLHFPIEGGSSLSVWGIGGIDGSGQKAETDSTKWVYLQDQTEQTVDQFMAAGGVTYATALSNQLLLRSTLAITGNGIELTSEELRGGRLELDESIRSTTWNMILSTRADILVGEGHRNRTGIEITGLNYDMFLQETPDGEQTPRTLLDDVGRSYLLSAYTSSTFRLGNAWKATLGLHGQLFTLNDHYTIEPRAGLSWRFQPNQSVGLAYGMHSRLERLNIYLARTEENESNASPNAGLDFSKAHHIVASYDLEINPDLRMKIEPYYQHLFNIPVDPDGSFSLINLQAGWFLEDSLTNHGEGRNVGVDLTLEHFLHNGYYFLLTGSLFSSRYSGGDGIWRDTRFDRGYLLNLLAGKEWYLGQQKQNILSLNLRGTYQGGDRRTPVDMERAIAEERVVHDESRPFTLAGDPALLLHATVSYRINGKGHTSTFGLNLLNITGVEEFYGDRYNYVKQRVEPNYEAIVIPNISYRLEF